MKIKIHKPNFLLVLFAMYNLIYAVYMAGFLTRIVYLGALIIYLLASFFSIVYYKSGKIVLKQLKFWDETKLILLTAVCFIGVTLIRQIVYGNFGMFFIKRIFYLILPVLIVFCIVNTKVRNKEIFIYIILIRMIVQFVLTNIHHLTLRNILAISWFDTKSSLFESSQAHEFFIMTVILLCVKKRGLAILATVLCMLNFKRISFLLCILSWIVVPRLKEEEVPKWCVKVSFVMMLVSPFIMNWLYSSSGVTFFQRFGIDLDKFTSTRVTLVNFTLNHFKGQYNGYGAIRNYFEHYSTWYAHVGTMHCDVLSIYLECGILGLAVYVMNLLKICMKDQRVFAVLLYMFIEIIVSQFVESVPAWTLLFLFAALQDRNFVGKIKTKRRISV